MYLPRNGNKMTSGDIRAQIQLRDKAGIYQDRVVRKKLFAIIIGKSAGALIREVNASRKQIVTDSMLHIERAADIIPVTRNMQISAGKGSEAVRELFHGTPFASHRGKISSPRKLFDAEDVGV